LDGMQVTIGISSQKSLKMLTRDRDNDKMKLYTSKAWLTKRYQVDKKSPEDIAKECGASVETIYVYLAKFGLRKSKR
jgi:hypothetical protein